MTTKEGNASQPNLTFEAYRRWVFLIVGFDTIALAGLLWLAHDPTASWNAWAAIVTVGLVGIATVDGVILQVLVAGQMALTMDRQEIEMRLQRETAQNQWGTMQETLERTDQVIEQNKSLIETAQRQATQAERQANSGGAQSALMRETIAQTREQFAAVNRPFLGIHTPSFKAVKDSDDNDLGWAEIVLMVKNSGSSVARNVQYSYFPKYEEITGYDNIPMPDFAENDGSIRSNGVIVAGGEHMLRIEVPEHRRKQVVVDKTHLLYVWAKITYSGLADEPNYFVTMYCGYDLSAGAFYFCPDHNDAD